MPIREYRCETCQRTIETLQKMSDPELERFEGCGSEKPCELVRLFSRVALRCNGIDKSEDLFHEGKQNSNKQPVSITRDFMQVGPDGKATFTPMKPGEYDPRYVGWNANDRSA